jgi:prevent-host-death family protein
MGHSRCGRPPDRYARVSTDEQDLTAQRDALAGLGVEPERVYVDHGLTGTTRARPGLREALAACRSGDMLVVTKLDRLARSLPDAREIADELTAREVKLNLGGSVHDPTDPIGRLLFNVLAMVAEFEGDLIRMRTREGMKIARAKGRLRGKQPKLSVRQEAHLVALHRAGTTPAPSLPNCSQSPARRCTGRSNGPADIRPLGFPPLVGGCHLPDRAPDRDGTTIRTMTTLSVSEAKARLNELARAAHAEHERFVLTRNGRPEAVLLSVDDLEGLEITLEVLGDGASVAAIAESLAEIEGGARGVAPADLREELRRPLAG